MFSKNVLKKIPNYICSTALRLNLIYYAVLTKQTYEKLNIVKPRKMRITVSEYINVKQGYNHLFHTFHHDIHLDNPEDTIR